MVKKNKNGAIEKGVEKTGEVIDKGVDTGMNATKRFFNGLKKGLKKDKE